MSGAINNFKQAIIWNTVQSNKGRFKHPEVAFSGTGRNLCEKADLVVCVGRDGCMPLTKL
jgi:hypothetical protein